MGKPLHEIKKWFTQVIVDRHSRLPKSKIGTKLVLEALMCRYWLVDGNPAPGHDIIGAQANDIVFLDYG